MIRALGTASALALLIATTEPAAAPPNLSYKTDGGLEISLPWYLQWQWSRADADRTPIADAFGFRRARVALQIERPDVWDLKAEYDLEAGQWTDLAAGIALGSGRLRLGQYRMPLGLEQAASNRDAVFLERGLPNALVYARRLGAGYEWTGPRRSLRVAAFGRQIDGADAVPGAALRATWSPVAADGRLLHLGAAVGTEDFGGETKRFSARPDIGLVTYRAVDTGPIEGVERIDRLGLEAGWVNGPWSIQTEYVTARVDAVRGRGTADGWYLMATWSPTGDSRGYRDGLFRAPKPVRPWGGLELAARVGALDLDGGVLDGGRVETLTLGANWYIHPALRISANLVDVDGRRRGREDEPRILQIRVQTQF